MADRPVLGKRMLISAVAMIAGAFNSKMASLGKVVSAATTADHVAPRPTRRRRQIADGTHGADFMSYRRAA